MKPHYPVFLKVIDMNTSAIIDYEYKTICHVNSRYADWLFGLIVATEFTEEQLSAIVAEIEAVRRLESHAPSPEAD